jgi:cytoskeleton-associated protein 5
LFALLLQIVRPFPSQGTLPDSQEARVAELVLKCIWKLARNIPQDLAELKLDPVELFPAIEHFLQSVPPNEWRARSANRVPCGDMPLRTIKVIIQHVVGEYISLFFTHTISHSHPAHYGDDVYDILSGSFDDPSATIVYPYVYRILNSSTTKAENGGQTHHRNGSGPTESIRGSSPVPTSRAGSPDGTASVVSALSGEVRQSSPSHRTSRSRSSINGVVSPPAEEPDPDAQLNAIIGHISSETTGAMHKEGITELHHFLKQYPHKKARVDKLLEATGPAFRKYISRALASRAAEDEERDVAVADTLHSAPSRARAADAEFDNLSSELESQNPTSDLQSPTRIDQDAPRSPMSTTFTNGSDHGGPISADERQDKLSRLHNIFQYRTSTSSHGRATPSIGSTRSPP